MKGNSMGLSQSSHCGNLAKTLGSTAKPVKLDRSIRSSGILRSEEP